MALDEIPFASLAALDDFIHRANESQDAFEFVKNASNGSTSGITTDILNQIMGLNDVIDENLSAYQGKISAQNSTYYIEVDDLQRSIDAANLEQEVVVAINDNDPLDLSHWQTNNRLSRVYPENLAAYNAEAALRKPFVNFVMVDIMIGEVNSSVTALTKIQDAAGGDTSALTSDDFDDVLNLVGFINANESCLPYRDW